LRASWISLLGGITELTGKHITSILYALYRTLCKTSL